MPAMRAVQLVAFGIPGRFELTEVEQPVPKDDEVVVEVHACGLNRLDLWLEENALPIRPELPRVPGGELAGRVVATGASAGGWELGARVAVQSNFCGGGCEFCARGEESMCLAGYPIGVLRDGGFAEQVAVPARSLL